jgi:hypothetical protein
MVRLLPYLGDNSHAVPARQLSATVNHNATTHGRRLKFSQRNMPFLQWPHLVVSYLACFLSLLTSWVQSAPERVLSWQLPFFLCLQDRQMKISKGSTHPPVFALVRAPLWRHIDFALTPLWQHPLFAPAHWWQCIKLLTRSLVVASQIHAWPCFVTHVTFVPAPCLPHTVPDFTPVHPARRQGISSTLPKLAAPVFQAQTTPRLPVSLMGPRYSHLLEEARSLSKQDVSGPSTPGEPSTSAGAASDDELTTSATSHSIPIHSVKQEVVSQTPSMGSRMKGFFFSYLPTLKKKTPVQKTHEPARRPRPGLPLPPPEVLEKPHGPVISDALTRQTRNATLE